MGTQIEIETNNVLYKSPINTPVYSDLSIKGDSYVLGGVVNSNGDLIGGTRYYFLDINVPSAVFKVSREHRIVWTDINGLNGEIPEYIGTKNWEIECSMIFTGSNLLYPLEIQNILTMLNSNQMLTVNSWYLNQFGIYNIIIEHEDEPQVEGDLFNQRISFKAKSVAPITLMFSNLPDLNSAQSNIS